MKVLSGLNYLSGGRGRESSVNRIKLVLEKNKIIRTRIYLHHKNRCSSWHVSVLNFLDDKLEMDLCFVETHNLKEKKCFLTDYRWKRPVLFSFVRLQYIKVVSFKTKVLCRFLLFISAQASTGSTSEADRPAKVRY